MKNNIVETIKERLDITELVRQYVPHLKKAGKTWKACCPFHQEKTPSFTVNSEKGLYYCFGCQEGGDIFAFLMKAENLSFNEAVRKLAETAGVEYQPLAELSGEEKKRVEARKLMDFAKKFYHKNLMSAGGEFARNYIKERNLTKETAVKFELGFAKNDATDLCKNADASGYKARDLKENGLCVLTDYGARDYFRGRLMFPIINPRGETIGFGGRILGDGSPKYLNSPETRLFNKSRVLYGLNFAGPVIRKEGRAVLLEGYMDVIACHQAGVENTVAPLGTSLTPDHAKLLKRYTDEVVVLFDPDSAGVKAALRGALILISEGLYVKVASLSEGLDPDEYLSKYGKEKFDEVLADAQDLIEFHTGLLLKSRKLPLGPQDKTALISELVETIHKQPDEIVRREWVKYAAEQIGVDEKLVLERAAQPSAAGRFPPRQTAPVKKAALNPAEENLITWLLKFPVHLNQCTDLTPEHFENATMRSIFQELQLVHKENPLTDNAAEAVIQKLPDLKNEVIRLSLLELPQDFTPQRDIASCAKTLNRVRLERELSKVQQQIKRAGTGQVPPEIMKHFLELQNKLKTQR